MENNTAAPLKMILGFSLTFILLILLSLPGLVHTTLASSSSRSEQEFPAGAATASPQDTALDAPYVQSTAVLYLPLLSKDYFVPTPTEPPPPTPVPQDITLYCDDLIDPIEIPDDDPQGVDDRLAISDNKLINSLSLYLDIEHSWIGDLKVTLTNENSNITMTAVDRPGIPQAELGCGGNNIITILDDQAIQSIENKCSGYDPTISGIYQPNEPLFAFTGVSITGTWRLNVSDNYPNDMGRLNHWCLAATLVDTMPQPTPTPPPINLPDSAYVSGMTGQDQLYELDCESRSAVDWARHFGFDINEEDFLNRLPRSDDPEVGFVGDPGGFWGNIPPGDYGVHAPPVASLLQDYGLTAYSYRSMQWDELRAQIASGNPVMVWIIGGVSKNLVNGIPHYYTAPSTGKTTIVAPHEHTVIVVGYTPDDVTILNGGTFVDTPIDQFLDSWSALQFRAVAAGS